MNLNFKGNQREEKATVNPRRRVRKGQSWHLERVGQNHLEQL